MKIKQTILMGVLSSSLALVATAPIASAQETVVTSTSALEEPVVIEDFQPAESRIVVQSTEGRPSSYYFTKSTQFVDEDGRVVSLQSVKRHRRATVYYTRAGDRMVASRVVFASPSVVQEPTVIEETTTTTTTRRLDD